MSALIFSTSSKVKIQEKIEYYWNTIKYTGWRFNCPCCEGNFREFLSFGVKPRPNAQCPRCGSMERHRLLWLYLKTRTNLFLENLCVLDVAPMKIIQEKCGQYPNIKYTSIDIKSPLAMLKMDVTDLKFPDNSFDCIMCYHVLEHIPDDITAIKELFRVLKPGGWAILQVPVWGETTLEDKSIMTPEEREKVFGDQEHVRKYGKDYKTRLENVGFHVKVDPFARELGEIMIRKYGLSSKENIYFSMKPE